MVTRKEVEDVLDYLDHNGLIRLSRSTNTSSGWRQLHCPFHNNGQERKPSCGCSLESTVMGGREYKAGQWHCFSCGIAYPFGKGLREILDLKGTTVDAHPILRKYIEEGYQGQEDHSLIPDELMSSVINKFAADDLRMKVLGKKEYVSEEELAKYRFYVPYMFERKLTKEVIDKYDIGYDANFIPPGRSKPLPSVTFPVHDQQGRTLFICRRSIGGKFFHIPSNVEKSVFGLYELPPSTREVIICESVFNALTAVVYGHPAVALFGTGTTYEIEQLKRLGVNSYVLCLDNDEAGHKGTERLKKALSNYALVWTMPMPNDGRDLNDLTEPEFKYYYSMKE